jgi:hypothetical protein
MRAAWGAFGLCDTWLEKESIVELSRELDKGRLKFPHNRFLLAALTEEVGELASTLLQRERPERIKREALQVAAVAMRIYEEGDATFEHVTDEEAQP